MKAGFTRPDHDSRKSLLDPTTAKLLDIVGDEFDAYLGYYCGIATQAGIRIGRVAHSNARALFLNPYISNSGDAYYGIKYRIEDNPRSPLVVMINGILAIDVYANEEDEGLKILREQVKSANQQRQQNIQTEQIKEMEQQARLRELRAKLAELDRNALRIVSIEGYQSRREN